MITRLTEKIWVIEGAKPFNTHSLYIRDGGGILIDAGSDGSEIEHLGKEEGSSTVVLSHCHIDHIFFLHTLPDVEVWASVEDAPALESLDVLVGRSATGGTEWEAPSRERYIDIWNFQPRKATRTISDGEELHFGETRAIAVITPGHTLGHMCLHFPDEGILFLGDYNLSAFGPSYSDKASSIDEFRRSSRRLAAIGAKTNVAAHGKAIHRGSIAAKVEAYLSVIDRREEALRKYLVVPRTRAEIISRRLIYGPRLQGPFVDAGEWSMCSKHIQGMIDRGEAALRDGVYFLTR
jgi:glyoxylase-like metal-dependent hydrolase (beta-lactamase superfamily II)